MDATAPLGRGVRGPDFVLTSPAGTATRFYAIAGGQPTALVLGPMAPDPDLIACLAPRADVALISVRDAAVATMYGVPPDRSTVVVLDPDLRIVGVLTGDQPTAEVVALLESAAHDGPQTEVRAQAPVLFVPRVVDAALGSRLIRLLETDGGVATGVEASTNGRRNDILDDSYKRRRDHTVDDAELLHELSSVVGRRVMPEIRKAFAVRATRFEGFKVVSYDADTGGFFRAHRDNLSPSTAHRVFALTLNLNDAYAGGQLRFPEYGNQLYRPSAGEALVFSCAHLHEVRDVTAGRRYVLLSFLYGEPTPDAAPRGRIG